MNTFFSALNATLPAFLLIGIGAIIDKRFPNLSIATLSKLAIYVLIPALIFRGVIGQSSLSFSNVSSLALAYLLYMLSLGIVSIIFSSGLTVLQARGLLATVLFANTGNMGLPITRFAYGDAGFERALVLFMLSIFLMFAFGPALLSGKTQNLGKQFIDALKLPPIWACLAAIAVKFLPANPQLSNALSGANAALGLLADAAIPIMLLSLGMQMSRSWQNSIDRTAFRSTGLHFVYGPVLAYIFARLFNLDTLDFKVFMLMAVMPAAVTMFVIAVEVEGDFVGVARTVVMHTVASLLAIVAVIALFPA